MLGVQCLVSYVFNVWCTVSEEKPQCSVCFVCDDKVSVCVKGEIVSVVFSEVHV